MRPAWAGSTNTHCSPRTNPGPTYDHLQDWTIRYGISKAEGVAEVASVGGFVKQYNIIVDPNRLKSLNIPLAKVRDAVRGQQYGRRRAHRGVV